MPELRTKAIVLRRTNIGEADRILNLLTPEGQKSVKAKGVRKEKSRLAGGIEMFSLSDVVIHEGRSNIGILTSAKTLKFYQNILADFERLELASSILKTINRASSQVDSSDFFDVTRQSFSAIDQGWPLDLINSWFLLNLSRIAGTEPNLLRDRDGLKLASEKSYEWDSIDSVLVASERGPITANHIKLMRLMLVSPLTTVSKVQNTAELLPEILYIAKSWYN